MLSKYQPCSSNPFWFSILASNCLRFLLLCFYKFSHLQIEQDFQKALVLSLFLQNICCYWLFCAHTILAFNFMISSTTVWKNYNCSAVSIYKTFKKWFSSSLVFTINLSTSEPLVISLHNTSNASTRSKPRLMICCWCLFIGTKSHGIHSTILSLIPNLKVSKYASR